jgi:serine/threonine-protein kinase
MFQIIKMDPHPLTPRVPGLPLAVEQELRRALSKRPEERFSSIRNFSRAFQVAALGSAADLTPTPVLGFPVLPASADIGHSEKAQVSGDGLKSEVGAPATDTESIRRWPWQRLRPIHALVAAAGVLLLVGAFLLFRSGPASNPPAETITPPAVSPVVVTPIPPLPAPPAAKPEPAQIQPALVAPEPARAKPAKSAKPAVPAGRARAKAPATPSAQPKAKRQLIKEL